MGSVEQQVRSLLGYTRPEVRYALVRVDRIEGFLVEQVLPSVQAAEESVIVRDYADETGTQWVTDFEGWAHEDLRAEAQAALGKKIVTPILNAGTFWPAEDYHQDYLQKKPDGYTCHYLRDEH